MDIFFSGSSACDKGTLSNIKNAYGHRSVQKDVSNCFNYAVDLLDHTTDSLTIVLAMQLLGMKNITERPANAPSQEEEKTKFMDDICEKIINTVWQDFGLKALTKAVADTDSEAEQQYEYCFCHEGKITLFKNYCPVYTIYG